ncbi:MAG TPA: homocitrate synthase [Bacillota bacterium]|nr:homocitrate synthase [Bacillota bacterium]
MKILDNMPMEGTPWFEKGIKWVSPMNFDPNVRPETTSKRIYIHDVTLRDGEQTCGLHWTEDERVEIALALDRLGVDRIEVGMPVVSKDIRRAITRLVKMDLRAAIVPFARCMKEDIDAARDAGAKHVVVEHAVNPYTCLHGNNVDKEQLIDRIVTSVNYAKEQGLRTTFMGWDVTRATLDYVLGVYERVVRESEPEAVVFTDSFGVASPMAIFHSIRSLKERLPGVRVEFHVHNEFGMAMGSVMAAAYAGVDGIHSSINGLGERTGNVATEEVAAALKLLLDIDTGIDISKLDGVCKMVERITGIPTWRNKPVTGTRLFWLESGVVVDAKTKLEKAGLVPAMCPYMPEVVGREPIKVVMGSFSGKASVKYFLDEKGLEHTDSQVEEILEKVKALGRVHRRVLEDEEVEAIIAEVLGK